MRLTAGTTPQETAVLAATWLASTLREAVATRGQASLAVSGGSTPGLMFRTLSALDIPWEHLTIFQVDERVTNQVSGDRNLRQLLATLPPRQPRALHLHAMPVDSPVDPSGDGFRRAAARYGQELNELTNGVVDVVHLGLGDDGHTASLVPGDPVLDELELDVGMTLPYNGYRRMTFTFPVLFRARCVLWLATGESKARMVQRLTEGDTAIEAGVVVAARVASSNAASDVLFVDDAAGSFVGSQFLSA